MHSIIAFLSLQALLVSTVLSRDCPVRLKRGYSNSEGLDNPERSVSGGGDYGGYPYPSYPDNQPANEYQAAGDLSRLDAAVTIGIKPADGDPTQTGIGAKVVSSFTVKDLATIVKQLNYDLTTAVESPQATPAPFTVAQPMTTSSAESSYEWNNSAWAQEGLVTDQSTPSESPANGLTFVPTTTGIAAAQRGFVTVTTSINFGALSSQIAAWSSEGSQASATPVIAAEANTADSSEMPGQKLSVLPIGLGVLGGLALLALIVVSFVTFERRKYRQQFRNRLAAQSAQAVVGMRQARTP